MLEIDCQESISLSGGFESGVGVTTIRAHVQYVVAEFGTAYLHGKSIRERSEALTGIAHPAFREALASRT